MVSIPVQIGICISGLIVFGSFLSIITPILATTYESLYFISLWTSIQFVIIFGILYLIVNRFKVSLPNHKLSILFSGIFSATMSLFSVYAASPLRCPPVMQSVLSGLGILPNVLFTKYILRKPTVYIKKFIIPSIILLLASIGISIIPLAGIWSPLSVLWIGLFVIGVISRSLYGVFQEKYLTDSQDGSVKNKITVMFYTRVVHLLTVIPFFFLEWVIGYNSDPLTEFSDSFIMFFTKVKESFMMEGFILAYVIFFIFSLYLNSISSNYNMIASIIITPATGIFFSIFPSLNKGVSYPIYIIIPSLVCCAASVVLWIIGERIGREGYEQVDDKSKTIN